MYENRQTQGWIIQETGFDPRYIAKGESILAQGNGYLNLR